MGRAIGGFDLPGDAVSVVDHFHRDPRRRVRLEVVRALRRMAAWMELRIMAEEEPEPLIRQLAVRGAPDRAFGSRMARFVQQDVQPLARPAARSRMPLWIGVLLRGGRPPKPAWLIRQILERIHAVIRGRPAEPLSDQPDQGPRGKGDLTQSRNGAEK